MILAESKRMKQIVVIGGGGFLRDSRDLRLEKYILKQAGKKNPSVCFIPTASGESAEYIVKFYSAFGRLGCRTSHLSLFRPPTADLESFIMEKDIIYVGGGNTKSMLALWQEWKLDSILKGAWEKGVILSGVSAGAICWFEEGVTDSVPGEFRAIKGLGFLKGSFCPHYDSEPDRQPAYHRLLDEGKIQPGYAVMDYAALHFIDDELKNVFYSKTEARACFVEAGKGKIKETVL